MTLRQITKEEWGQYEWIEATTTEDQLEGRSVFIRGIKYKDPPDDQFVYCEKTRISDSEQRWNPAMTHEEE